MTDDEREHGPALDETETIRLPRSELARLLNDNARLNAQIAEVQAANSALVEERRILKHRLDVLVEENRAAGEFENRVYVVLRERATALGVFRGTSPADAMIGEASDALERETVRANDVDRSAMVREFFERVAPHQERLVSPGVPSPETVRFRVRLVVEEFVELLDAVFDDRARLDLIRYSLRWYDEAPIRSDLSSAGRLAEAVDALVDLAYVAEGFLVSCGVDGNAVFRLVHDANLKKAGAPVVNMKRMKPAGWTPPDVAGELERQRLAAVRKGAEDEGSTWGPTETRPNVEPPRDGPPGVSDEDIAREAARYANERVRHIVGSAEPTPAQTRLAARLLRGEQTSDVGGWVDTVSAFVAGANLFRGAAKT